MPEILDAVRSMQKKAEQEIIRLQGTIASKVKDLGGIVDILLYFDEAHEMTVLRPVEPETKKTLYSVFLSVLNDYRNLPLFIVFLSTLSHIADFAPPRAQVDSARGSKSGSLQAPITETPFDCAPDILVVEYAYDREGIAQIHFISRFGRPL